MQISPMDAVLPASQTLAITTPASSAGARGSEAVAQTMETVSIVGSGNSARALASYLSSRGYPVHLLVRSLDTAQSIAEQGVVKSSGKIVGEHPIALITTDIEAGIREARTVFIATVTTAYPEIARKLAPHLRAGQEVILFSSKFGGVVEFSNVLTECGARDVIVLETDALFACRTQEDGSVWIRGFKDWTLFSAANRSQTTKHRDVVLRYFPGLQQADNVVQRGLTDFGALAHPLTMLVNMNQIDRAESFPFYHEGFTKRTIALMERMEQEFRNVGEAYGSSLIPMSELLNRYYGCDTSSILAAMRSVPNYRVSQAPTTLQHRYIEEDVSCSLVPIQQLARTAGIETPVVDAVVCFASTLLGEDFAISGRNLKKLGWAGFSQAEIMKAINE